MAISHVAVTRGTPAWLVQNFKVSPRLPAGPPSWGHTPPSRAAAWPGDLVSEQLTPGAGSMKVPIDADKGGG